MVTAVSMSMDVDVVGMAPCVVLCSHLVSSQTTPHRRAAHRRTGASRGERQADLTATATTTMQMSDAWAEQSKLAKLAKESSSRLASRLVSLAF